VLFENVPGILGRIAGEDGRNIDKVFSQLHAAGYSCQHAVFDSQNFMLPQRRRRVYAMATRGDMNPECCAAWPRLVRACSPSERIPLSACLM
jgi:site-specific DNA-cytosine methylase